MTRIDELCANGIRRTGSPERGFEYRRADGKKLTRDDLTPIQQLVIPPAWTNVCINSKLLVAVAALAALVSSVFAQEKKHQFTLSNQTGVEIHQLYLSPHSSDNWEENVPGRETLPDGENVQIIFDDRDKHDLWDLKVVDGNGASITWEKLDLTKIGEVTIHYKSGKAWADVK